MIKGVEREHFIDTQTRPVTVLLMDMILNQTTTAEFVPTEVNSTMNWQPSITCWVDVLKTAFTMQDEPLHDGVGR